MTRGFVMKAPKARSMKEGGTGWDKKGQIWLKGQSVRGSFGAACKNMKLNSKLQD